MAAVNVAVGCVQLYIMLGAGYRIEGEHTAALAVCDAVVSPYGQN